ncbi:hypothetical protein BKA69DRAFT_1082889 [Paraphysoderma sedebokerense]|nr:hypothetical protein BKA69DRAFT_1082889 [Paraphysoderma sedebokerense]
MGLRFGKETVVIVSDEKLAKEVLSGKGRVYADKPKSYLLGEILTESYGDLAMVRL